jgi:1-acyl-sn-glycerol-3-phosphate acyltransferase
MKALLRFALQIFYRRIEVVGIENVRRDRAVVFAVNHPNGLVDPLFVLSFAPRRVSFLAKAPLFRYPIIGWIVRRFDSIPVYRKQDDVSGSNRETFARAREILARGGSIAIFPEGTTHSDPQLHPLKTGVARIALGASLPSLDVVPTGIYYTEKQTFRSSAVVVFGTPIEVRPEPIDENGEPHRESVDGLTMRIDDGLDAVTLQADSHSALDLITRAEEIFSADEEQSVAEELELRRRFVEGYHYLRERDPLRLAILEAGIMNFVWRRRPRQHASIVDWILLPIAIIGAIANYATYRLIGAVTNRLSRENEMRATFKFIGALAFYPLTWLAIAAVLWWRVNALAAIATLVALPILGYVALRVFESLATWSTRPRKDLAAQREAIRDEILKVWEEMRSATAPESPPS